MQDKSMRTLVIGLGNPLMGDDAFGSRVIQRLRREASNSPLQADLVDAHTDLLGQIDQFPAYERVVLVDAILDPEQKVGSAGQVVLLEEQTMRTWPETSSSAHQLAPILAVRLFRRLHPHAATQILLVGLCTDKAARGYGADAGPGALSEQAVAAGAGKVRELL